MRIDYNAPLILTYTLICTLVLVLTLGPLPLLTAKYFTLVPGWDFGDPVDWLRKVSHVIGHANWEHLFGNFSFILLIGPILEEKYGWKDLLFMMFITAFVTGVAHALLFDNGLLGASGIVFMMILLGSLVNVKKGTLPLTFVFIIVLYLGREIYTAVTVDDNISQFGHLMGGACGAVLGFIRR